jgi:hypothetical protein
VNADKEKTMKIINRYSIRFQIASLGVLLVASAASALAPRTIPFQGKLTNSAGQPITAATSVVLSLYTAPTGGTAIWSETKTVTPSADGLFSTLLGSTTAFPASVTFDAPYYLGVKVGASAEMTPRAALAAVPYALSLPNVTVSSAGNVGIGTTTPGDRLAINGRLAFQQKAGDEVSAGKIDYRGFDPNSLSIVGAGTTSTTRNVRLFDTLSVGYSAPTGAVAAFNGAVGIGTSTPQGGLSVSAKGTGWQNLPNGVHLGLDPASVASIEIVGGSAPYIDFNNSNVGDNQARITLLNSHTLAVTGQSFQTLAVSGAVTANSATVNGIAQVNRLKIVGGSDLAEPYTVAAAGSVKPEPGMVVSIDPDHTGKLRVCSTAYDPTVAGIVSGANGVQPGITLTQTGTEADGDLPIANTGRVWCHADADANGAIQPGDMLTSSPTPGYAMKATDRTRSYGAVLGKAMSRLEHGEGYVLVLVGLQ